MSSLLPARLLKRKSDLRAFLPPSPALSVLPAPQSPPLVSASNPGKCIVFHCDVASDAFLIALLSLLAAQATTSVCVSNNLFFEIC